MKKLLLSLFCAASMTAASAAVTGLNVDFEANAIPEDWTQVQVAGDKNWVVKTYSSNYYASMSGHGGTAPFDQWLISPAVDMSQVTTKTLTFDNQVNAYGSTTTVFSVYVLNSADPATATVKTQLNPTLATAPASGFSDWTASGDLDLSAYTGEIYIGFRYEAPEAASATWCIDNIKLGEVSAPEIPITDVASISEFNTLQLTTPVKFTCELTAVYQQYNRLYVTDGKDFMLVYGEVGQTYKNGDKIAAGVVGTYGTYSGQVQLTSPAATTFAAGVAGTAVQPEVYQVEELSFDLLTRYVKILGVTVADDAESTNEKQFLLTDNTGTAILYNQLSKNIYPGENLTFEGFVGCYNTNVQLHPITDMGDAPQVDPIPENDAIFKAAGYTDIAGCDLINIDGSTTHSGNSTLETSLLSKEFTEKGITLSFPGGSETAFATCYGDHVRWYKNESITLTPAAGLTIEKVFVKTTGSKYNVDITPSTGTVDITTNPITWTGSATEALTLTATAATRFNYIQVTFSGNSGIEDVVVNDANAPVKYFNLQGVEVANPENGVFIRVQGNKASKVLVK